MRTPVRSWLFGLLTVLVLPFGSASSQTPPRGVPYAAGFQPGGQQLFRLDLASTPVGEIPTNIKLMQGTLEVVLKDGVPMLKASSASAFLITLSQPLPQDFTLEFDLVPKACCNPADLGIGEVNQGVASAHIEWDSDGQLRVVGGGELYQAPMPDDFTATLPGVRTEVGVSFQGTTVKLYTNGRRLFTLDRQFARKRELRISLGGQDDRAQAVYLAGLRIATGGPLIGIVQTTPQSGPRAATPFTPSPPGSASNPPVGQSPVSTPPAPSSGPRTVTSTTTTPTVTAPAAASGAVASGFTVTVNMGPQGPVVSWPPVPNATGYTVTRSKSDDLNCCNTSSGRSWGATSPWQDAPLPMPGTYVYTVLANTTLGQMQAQTQYTQAAPVTAVPAILTPSSSGPVTSAGSTARNIACTPGPATAPAPQMFRASGIRVGGAPLEWLNEPNTRYLVERAPAMRNLAPGATVSWTSLASTCDPSSSFLAGLSGLDETLTRYPMLQFDDVYPGVQLGGAYHYRLTRIQSDGTSGSALVYWVAPTAWFDLGPTASVSGKTVTLSTGIGFCQVHTQRCDPWMVEFTVTSSTSGFSYSTRQVWKNSYDPSIPGSVEGNFVFAIPNVPSGTHTFTVTAVYQPDHRVTAGSVTVVIP